jgi:hypothetical protein
MVTGLYRVTDSLGRFSEVPITVNLGTSKFPTADTTGTKRELRPYQGPTTITTPGFLIEGVVINSPLKIDAANVTVRHCRISTTTTKYPVEMVSGSVTVEDSIIDGNGAASCAVLGGNYTLRRCDIRNVKDGPRIQGDNVLLDACYIHDLTRVPGGHHDTVQMRSGRNVVIRGCTLQAYRADTDDPMNAAIQFGSWIDAVPENVLVEGNYMDGGNQTINGGFPGLTVRGNTFGPHARYGLIGSLGGAAWKDNVREDGSAV